MTISTDFYAPNVLARAEVTVSRTGWVTDKETDSIIGRVYPDTNASDRPLWRAQALDTWKWTWKRADAIQQVLDIHNMHEKARAYDLRAK